MMIALIRKALGIDAIVATATLDRSNHRKAIADLKAEIDRLAGELADINAQLASIHVTSIDLGKL